MTKAVRHGVIALAVLVGVGYLTPVVYLMANEKRMIFQPDEFGGRVVVPLPDSLGLVSTRVSLTSADSTKISGVVIPVADTAAQWLLYLHGNAGNVTSSVLPQFYARWHAIGLNILAIDYRGYGESESRTPDEKGTYTDARAAYEWLRTTRGVPPERIILYGHSLGAGIATELALRVQVAGLIIEGAFTSVPDLGAEIYPWVPVRLISRQRFDNMEKIGRVAMPKMVMHAIDDDIVPYVHGQRLYEAARAPKDWVRLRGGHMNAFLQDSAHFWRHARGFVERLRTDLPAAESPAPRAR